MQVNSRWFPSLALVAAFVLLFGSVALILHQRASSSGIAEVTTQTFEQQVLKSPVPVYVEFYSTQNCTDCANQAPVIEKVATDMQGKVRFVRVDADKNSDLLDALGLTGAPLPLHLFINPSESVALGAAGFKDETALRAFIDKGLNTHKQAAPNTQSPAPSPSTPNNQPTATPSTPDQTQPKSNPGTPDSTQPKTDHGKSILDRMTTGLPFLSPRSAHPLWYH